MSLTLQIVTAIGGPALLDLNEASGWAGGGHLVGARGDLDLAGVVQGERGESVVWTPAGMSVEVTDRQISVPVVLIGSSADDLSARVAMLNRLTSSAFWLRIQRHQASESSWLRCYPTVARLRTDVTGAGSPVIAAGTLTAMTEPYAYGARVDVPPATVGQNPAVAGAFVVDVNGVTGDALTPAYMRWTDPNMVDAGWGLCMAIRRHGVPAALGGFAAGAGQPFLQGEAVSSTVASGGATGAVFTDAGMSGGQVYRVSFPTTTDTDHALRLNYNGLLLGSEAPGTHRLLARLRRNGNAVGDAVMIRVYVAGRAVHDTQMQVSTIAGGVVDLGLIQVPAGLAPGTSAPIAVPTGAACAPIGIELSQKTRGAGGSVDVDWVGLVPADEDLTVAHYGPGAPGAAAAVAFDPFSMSLLIADGDPLVVGANALSPGSTQTIRVVGGGLRLRPGSNRLFMVASMYGLATPWALGDTMTVKISYWPRYTWLR